jgi:Holliday junction resolvase-like predicted endonuclease
MNNSTENIIVVKNTGERVRFDAEKLKQALLRSGATDREADLVEKEVLSQLYDGIHTRRIYQIAYKLLRKKSHRTAGRYKLKKAVMELGPSGYPFEKFMGRLFENRGYKTEVGVTVQGKCVTHEIDVIANNGREQIMVECKFHGSKTNKSDVKVPLYIHSRFLDVKASWEQKEALRGIGFFGMVATNTRFTEDAVKFANCSGLRIISWDYPAGNSLREWIDQSGFYPITALQSLRKKDKELLLENNLVLCRELDSNRNLLRNLGFDNSSIKKILTEAAKLID